MKGPSSICWRAWIAKPGSAENHDLQRVVGLYHVSLRHGSKGTNAAQLSLDGGVTIARGYLLESSGAFEGEEATSILDEKIRYHFPNGRWRGKHYYLRVDDDPEGLIPFLDWVADYMAEACEAGQPSS